MSRSCQKGLKPARKFDYYTKGFIVLFDGEEAEWI